MTKTPHTASSHNLRYYAASEVHVHCPRCDSRAVITERTRLRCPNCHFSQDERRRTYVAEFNPYCVACGRQHHVSLARQATPTRKQYRLKCRGCGHVEAYPPRYREEEWVYGRCEHGAASDPVYGLPLWLRAMVRGRALWAYNDAHLAEIEAYVRAGVRMRSRAPWMSMTEKLPKWIASRKSRTGVLRAITRMRRKGL